MPKTPIDKYRYTVGWESEIGRANNLSVVHCQPLIFCRTSMERSRHSVERLPFDLMARIFDEREVLGLVNNGREFFMLKDE